MESQSKGCRRICKRGTLVRSGSCNGKNTSERIFCRVHRGELRNHRGPQVSSTTAVKGGQTTAVSISAWHQSQRQLDNPSATSGLAYPSAPSPDAAARQPESAKACAMDVWQAPNRRLALRCVSERCPNQLCQGVALIPQVPRPLFASGLGLAAGRSPCALMPRLKVNVSSDLSKKRAAMRRAPIWSPPAHISLIWSVLDFNGGEHG